MKRRNAVVALVLLVLVAAFAAGCSEDTGGSEGLNVERKTTAGLETNYAQAQPVPSFTKSQIRENLIDLQTAQAEGVQTTSFFFNLGVRDPVQVCPSIGSPIASTSQLSNPQQVIERGERDNGSVTLPQMDPTGIYQPPDSSGTYVICVGADGKPYANYWEGFVQAVFGPAKWNPDTGIELIGPPSFDFSSSPAKGGG